MSEFELNPTNLGFNLYESILSVLPDDTEAYLVGGFVRDSILGRETNDLDFILSSDAIKHSRQIADILGGAFFVLDDEHYTSRIIIFGPDRERINLDFSLMRQSNLIVDLQERDFTVNSIAVDLRSLSDLIDPMRGNEDLEHKLIRTLDNANILRDPIRIIRGFRLAEELGFSIEPNTLDSMQKAVKNLPEISKERIRDEIFRILEGINPAKAFREMDRLDIFDQILPEMIPLKEMKTEDGISGFEHGLLTVETLSDIMNTLIFKNREISSNYMEMISRAISPFVDRLKDHFCRDSYTGRSPLGLMYMGAFCHDIGKQLDQDLEWQTAKNEHGQIGREIADFVSNRFRLSNLETSNLKTMIFNHMLISEMLLEDSGIDRRKKYRFFNTTGGKGIETCLIALSNYLVNTNRSPEIDKLEHFLSIIFDLFDAWWNHRSEMIDPPSIINGFDIMKVLNIKPGPWIGSILESLREAQAVGQVETWSEAIHFIKNLDYMKNSQ